MLVTAEVGNQNSGKAGNDMELGDCCSWDRDKLGMGKLSCLSAKVWAITELLDISCSSLAKSSIVVEVLAASSVTGSIFNLLLTFKTEKTTWLTN